MYTINLFLQSITQNYSEMINDNFRQITTLSDQTWPQEPVFICAQITKCCRLIGNNVADLLRHFLDRVYTGAVQVVTVLSSLNEHVRLNVMLHLLTSSEVIVTAVDLKLTRRTSRIYVANTIDFTDSHSKPTCSARYLTKNTTLKRETC